MKKMSLETDLNKALKELHAVTGLKLTLAETPEISNDKVLNQIQHLTYAYKEKYNKDKYINEKFNRESFIKELLTSDFSSSDIYHKANQLHIEYHCNRAVFIIETKNAKDPAIQETLRNLFTPLTNNFVIEINNYNLILVKSIKTTDSCIELNSIAKTIVDMLNTEAMSKVRVGYSSPIIDLAQLNSAYKEAQLALDIGTIFYMSKTTLSHSSLGLGRLIYHLPVPLCESFLHEILGEEPLVPIDEETLTTINIFFETGLNIAETARRLYIHRNTLIYRLEKLQKLTGLDLRCFDDAVRLKICLMVIQHLKYKENQKQVNEKRSL